MSHRAHGMAPFTGTTLDATLRGYGIDTVVLSGVSTNIALFGAAIEAVGLGYSVVLAEDCTAGRHPADPPHADHRAPAAARDDHRRGLGHRVE